MTQPESALSRKILKVLNEDPHIFAFKVHGSEYMMAGLPDIVACVDGQFIGFETKMPNKRSNVSPRQKYVHQLIENASGKSWVICSVNEALHHVQSLRSNRGII